MATTYSGLRSTEDVLSDQIPESWRGMILLQDPNGDTPLTAMSSLMKNEKIDSYKHNWWEKQTQTRYVSTSLFTNVDLGVGNAASGGEAAGTVLYAKVAQADAGHFRPRHQVRLIDESNPSSMVNAIVIGEPQLNGASSYVPVQTLEADDNTLLAGTTCLDNCDKIQVSGSVNPQGSGMPVPVGYAPTQYENVTQIFSNSLVLTRTLMQTKLRTGDAYQEAKREALHYHMLDMEMAFLWGVKKESYGTNQQPQNTTMGLIEFIRTYGSSNVSDYRYDSEYNNTTWAVGGQSWMEDLFEQVFRYGSDRRLVLCGGGALRGVNKLAQTYGDISIEPGQTDFGLSVRTWHTPFGTLDFKVHPLMNHTDADRYSAIIIEPGNLKYLYLQDTMFKQDKTYDNNDSSNGNAVDGKAELWLSEAMLEMNFPNTCGYLMGIGQDNTQT